MDHGDDRLGHAHKRRECLVIEAIVILGGIPRAYAFELGNVGSRREGLRVGPPQKNDPDAGIPLRLGDQLRDGLPHARRESVHARRIVGRDPGERPLDLEPELWLIGRSFGHPHSPLSGYPRVLDGLSPGLQRVVRPQGRDATRGRPVRIHGIAGRRRLV